MAKRLPPTRFPDAIVVGYARALKKQVREMGNATLSVFDEKIKEELKALNRADSAVARMDGSLGNIVSALAIITNTSNKIYDVYLSTNIATDSIKLLDKFNRKNMESQGRIVGVNPLLGNDKLSDFMQASIQENVRYISKLKDDYLTNAERIILQGAKKGETIKTIRQQLVAQTGMTQRRAEFIAKDQMGTAFGQLTAERHKSMGLESFIWRTSEDERVRETHERLNGKEFSYSNLPPEGLPGEDYACRCVAEPVFDD